MEAAGSHFCESGCNPSFYLDLRARCGGRNTDELAQKQTGFGGMDLLLPIGVLASLHQWPLRAKPRDRSLDADALRDGVERRHSGKARIECARSIFLPAGVCGSNGHSPH